jgi:hypothetical protein
MKISAKRTLLLLTTVAVVFYLLHVVLLSIDWNEPIYYEAIGLVDMDVEVSLPTWYSQTLLLLLAAILLVIGLIKRRFADRFYKSWFVLGGVMIFLSADEGAMIHEKLDIITHLTGMHDFLLSNGGAIFNYSWWALALILLVVLGIFMFKFFLSLPSRTRRWLVFSVAIFLFGSIGLDAYAGWYNSLDPTVYVSHFITGAEESCELIGLSLAIYTFLEYIKDLPKRETKKLPIKIIE